MILQKLCEYYERKLNDPTANVPKRGFGLQKVHFALLLDTRGKLLDVLDLRPAQNGIPHPVEMVVPEPHQRTGGPVPNFMCDNTGYALGADDKNNPARAQETFKSFKQLHHEIGDPIGDPGMKAVLRFLDLWDPAKAHLLQYWGEMGKGANLVFQLKGELRYVHDHSAVKSAWLKHFNSHQPTLTSMCLISGRTQPIASVHPKIKGVYGSLSTGGSIVSFEPKSFRFFLKSHGGNAPIGKDAAFKYTTALNLLLRRDSRQKVRIGDTTIVFLG